MKESVCEPAELKGMQNSVCESGEVGGMQERVCESGVPGKDRRAPGSLGSVETCRRVSVILASL